MKEHVETKQRSVLKCLFGKADCIQLTDDVDRRFLPNSGTQRQVHTAPKLRRSTASNTVSEFFELKGIRWPSSGSYRCTRRYIPEDSHLHTRRRENLKSHIKCVPRNLFLSVGKISAYKNMYFILSQYVTTKKADLHNQPGLTSVSAGRQEQRTLSWNNCPSSIKFAGHESGEKRQAYTRTSLASWTWEPSQPEQTNLDCDRSAPFGNKTALGGPFWDSKQLLTGKRRRHVRLVHHHFI
jgi:hypothetical protein